MRASSRGITLVEVVVAVTVLAIGTVLLVRSFVSSASASASAETLMAAYRLLEDRLLDKELEIVDGRIPEFTEVSEEVSVSGRTLRVTTRVALSDADEKGRLIEILSRAEWREGGRPRSATLATRAVKP